MNKHFQIQILKPIQTVSENLQSNLLSFIGDINSGDTPSNTVNSSMHDHTHNSNNTNVDPINRLDSIQSFDVNSHLQNIGIIY